MSLVVTLAGLNSCTKDNDEPQPEPVVGKWKTDIVRLRGLTGAFTTYNKDYVVEQLLGFSSSVEVKTDKTFKETSRGLTVESLTGTWAYSGSTLDLKYDNGDDQKLTYDATENQLLSDVIPAQDSLPNPTTGRNELKSFTLQIVYSKE